MHRAMLRFAPIVVLCAALFACPKAVPENVAGSDDEQMDSFAAQLEEVKTREVTCTDACKVQGQACGLSNKVCEISGRKADRADFQTRCVSAQEACAAFSDKCASCK